MMTAECGIKHTRFRFSEDERMLALNTLYSLVNGEIQSSEAELWQKLLECLRKDQPIRFNLCSLRTVKEHMLDQVSKFKKCLVAEPTESSKQRLKTPWGDIMRRIVNVWHHYEELVKLEQALKMSRTGRKRKIQEFDSEVSAKAITVLNKSFTDTCETLINPQFQSSNDEQYSSQDDNRDSPQTVESISICPSPTSILEEPAFGEENVSHENPHSSTSINGMHRSRGNLRDDAVLMYLVENRRLEMEARRQDRILKLKLHSKQMELEEKKQELEMKRLHIEEKKQEFEEKKWAFECKKWEMERAVGERREQSIDSVLKTFLQSRFLNRNPIINQINNDVNE